jgi:hypothetical protein
VLGTLVDEVREADVAPHDDWLPARLLPTIGIRGQEEQEKRATSSLLAVMHAVPEFGHALLHDLGAPKSPRVDAYTEVRFTNGTKTVIPDGVIVCERGTKEWTCLVEVKTAGAELRGEQVQAYLEVARDKGYDGVLTISNEITDGCDTSPVLLKGRKPKSTRLWHLSWWHILTEAIVQHRHHGISDPDQAWVLGELIAYLDSSASGAGGFDDMGPSWVAVRDGAPDRALRANDAGVRDVAARWDQFVQYLCLGLSQDLGKRVIQLRPRKQDQSDRLDAVSKSLAVDGVLQAAIRVPNAAGDIDVRADIRAGKVHVSVTVPAPGEGKPTTRINWLVRALEDARPDLLLSAHFPSARQPVTATLDQARNNREAMTYRPDPKRAPRDFTVTLARPAGQKRGRGTGSFVSETRAQVFDFYRSIMQELRLWQAKAPRLPEVPDPVPEAPAPDPPPFVAADAREVGSAIDPASQTTPTAAN